MTQYIQDKAIEESLKKFIPDESTPDQAQNTNSNSISELVNGIITEQTAVTDPDKEFFDKLIATNNRIKQAVIDGKSCEVPVLLYRNEEPFFHTNSINVISAATGSFKSTFQNTLMAATLNKGLNQYDYLGFRLNEDFRSKIRIILFDSEQSEAKVIQRVAVIRKAAGFEGEDYPDNFFTFPLSANSTKERIKALMGIIDRLEKPENKNLQNIVFLDVVTDLTKDINDSKEAPDIAAQLQQLVNLKNVTLFASIHKAKTTGTARGHIGTEMTNKSTTILSISRLNSATKKDASGNSSLSIYKMQTEKYREGKEQTPFEFTFNEENSLLRLATYEEKDQLHLKEKDQIRLLYESFGFNEFTVTNSSKEIEPKLIEIFGEKKARSYNVSLDQLCSFGNAALISDEKPLTIKIQKGKIGRKACYQVCEVPEIFESETNDH